MSGPVRRRTSPLAGAVVHGVLVVCALVMMAPLLWLVCASVKTGEDLFRYAFLPWGHLERLTVGNFVEVVERQPVVRWLANSLFLSSVNTVLVVTLSSLGGFALAKYSFAGKRVAMIGMLATMLLPAQVLLPSSYELVYRMGWVDTYAAIVVPGAVSVFGIFLYMQAMKGVPDELLDAARVDGASEFRLWWEMALPIVRPMTGAFTLMSFLASWNAFLWPQIVLQDERKYTLPIGLSAMLGLPEYQAQYGLLMAATLLSVLPVMGLFFVLQKDFIAGLASGAVKG
jgi:ABC-type glycerol-3-phosphate transport system permease component